MSEDFGFLKAEWLITRKCDFSCDYCGISKNINKVEDATEDQMKRTMEVFSSISPGAPMIVYGGEPTLRFDELLTLIRKAKILGIKLPVISSCYAIDFDRYKKLVDGGLSNWSISFDGFNLRECIDLFSYKKSINGFRTLLGMRSLGIRDLVACVTVTKNNIHSLPYILRCMTSEGIFCIFTPLQIKKPGYEYSNGKASDLPVQEDVEEVSEILYRMVKSGQFLCSNDAGWFKSWPMYFRSQDWKCDGKYCLTIDADGSLRYCVDIPFRKEDTMYSWELESVEGRNRFKSIIEKGPECSGCLWNPAYETIKRSRDPKISLIEGRQRSRHFVSPCRLDYLFEGSGKKFFGGNPHLNPVGYDSSNDVEKCFLDAMDTADEIVGCYSGDW